MNKKNHFNIIKNITLTVLFFVSVTSLVLLNLYIFLGGIALVGIFISTYVGILYVGLYDDFEAYRDKTVKDAEDIVNYFEKYLHKGALMEYDAAYHDFFSYLKSWKLNLINEINNAKRRKLNDERS
jgi:hypothetical protein